MTALSRLGITTLAALGLTALLFALSLTPRGLRDHSQIENIDGIPFPLVDGAYVVSEKLAHTDIYLREPVVAKQLRAVIDFDPQALEKLEVGVREGAFWLSYPRQTLYTTNTGQTGRQTVTVVIPLTDALQDTDRSVDVMFFATARGAAATEDEGVHDAAEWKLYGLEVTSEYVMPRVAQLKNYLVSILKRERPL